MASGTEGQPTIVTPTLGPLTPEAVETPDKFRIIPDRTNASWPGVRRVSAFPGLPPAEALDHTLDTITARDGERTTNMVAMQLEYPRG